MENRTTRSGADTATARPTAFGICGLEQEEAGQSRIVRGGNYRENRFAARAAHRYQYPAGSGDISYGFRPVRTVIKK
ncbi:hypothetical protein [Corallococcus terminator]|uniref:Sulfatase-modifying factor enzyme domain-containing protein n=1 Tax=Corallococcus terminator TaxID=2316733 RepID=A0A3A8JCA3_9BACT|nr:hypothetical protein [Corallococcus terminator]RKG93309.1 hypothetical protein D7V88_02910 [Corallococcus terminator]